MATVTFTRRNKGLTWRQWVYDLPVQITGQDLYLCTCAEVGTIYSVDDRGHVAVEAGAIKPSDVIFLARDREFYVSQS